MPFSNEDKALIKNLCQFEEYGSRRITTEFSKINGRTGHFTKKIRETGSTSQTHESGRLKYALTEENVSSVHCG